MFRSCVTILRVLKSQNTLTLVYACPLYNHCLFVWSEGRVFFG